MKRMLLPALLMLAFTNAGAAAPLQLNLKQGATATYRVAVSHSETRSDGNPANTMSNETPIKFLRKGPSTLQIETGPLFTLGRSVGRSKVKDALISPGGASSGRSPAPFFVVFPPTGANLGQKWTAPFGNLAPVPGGLTAQYHYVRATGDGKFAQLALKVDQPGSSKVSGSGVLFVRLSDGMLDHGNAKFSMVFMRPDMKDPKKMVVNSRTTADFKILPR